MSTSQRIVLAAGLGLAVLFQLSGSGSARADELDDIVKSGVLKVGPPCPPSVPNVFCRKRSRRRVMRKRCRGPRRRLAAQNRSFKSVSTVIRVACTVPWVWLRNFPLGS